MSMDKIDDRRNKGILPSRIDTLFDAFRDEIERAARFPLSFSRDFPAIFEEKDTRLALCDLLDKGDKYQLTMEMPGVDKKNIDIKASKKSIEISASQSEKKEEKNKDYIYNERSFKSFYRKIPLPEDIISDKIAAKFNNGVLEMELPKKVPIEEGEVTKIEVE